MFQIFKCKSHLTLGAPGCCYTYKPQGASIDANAIFDYTSHDNTLHASIFYSSGSVNMVRYQAKANKTVVVMSTLHRGSVCQIDGKKKPESVLYYNANKCGVDRHA